MAFSERAPRSLTKAITFRVLVTCSDFIIIYAIFGRPDLAFAVVVVTNVWNSVLYFGHERIWNSVRWGRRS